MAPPVIGVQRTITVGEPLAGAMARSMGHFTPWFAQAGWQITGQAGNSMTYGTSSFRTWQIVVAILFFPIGLIALLAEKRKDWLTATFTEVDGNTAIMVTGSISSAGTAKQVADGLDWFDPSVQSVGSEPLPAG